ncbi:MAG: GTPase Era [Microscillaceae bacterium]|jgi:GTP-binding protein Era|nr:GTPase Era [Microscillaceae bacterium]
MENQLVNENTPHRAGFVSIIGKPNVGKSTLMNRLVGEKLSIITAKAQTTRHRIMGILSSPDFQIVYSDTPGVINPKYELHKSMMRFVHSSLEDADLILWVTDWQEKFDENEVWEKIKEVDTPIFLIINKIDLDKSNELAAKLTEWQTRFAPENIIAISALKNKNLDVLFQKILEKMPLHPPYFPEDELTDRSERFFASEIIREKIFENYQQEIPYACEVIIQDFKDKEDILVIRTDILVERDTQKGILIGKKGESLKKLGVEARQELEKFFGKKVFLEQFVKVEEDWRKKKNKLDYFGYNP